MVICKYFLQGTCRFGENCKFEHQINTEHSYAGASSILHQNYAAKPQTNSNVDTNTLVKAVFNDMTAAEKGGQWVLSSYAPFREKPAFPGFEDHSMEEVRFLFYESLKNGILEQYKQNLQAMLQQAMMKIKALQNPSPEAVNMLKSIYDTPASSSFNNNQNQATSTVFAAAPTPQKTIFGNVAPNQNIFATPTNNMQQNAFPATNTNSIFGGNQFTAQQQSPQKSIFGGQPAATNTNSIFGGAPFSGVPSQGLFNQQQSPPFVQQNPPAYPTQQANIFQNNQFAPTTNAPNPFGAPPNATAPFTNPQATNSQFGPPQQNFVVPVPQNQFVPQIGVQPTPGNKPAFQHTQSIFGNMGVQAGFGAPVQSQPNEEFYSRIEDLTEEEIKWFQSDDLDISKIPDKPPTYEMCFKVQ